MKKPDVPAVKYSTNDLYLAGGLLASGRKLLRLDWLGGRASFIFEDLAKCEQASRLYWSGNLRVAAKGFADALRTLKDRLYENKNGAAISERELR